VACPGPVAEQLAAARYAVAAAPDAGAGIIDGSTVVSIGVQDRPGAVVTAGASGAGTTLDGTKVLVPYAHGATRLLVTAATPGGTAYCAVDPHGPSVNVEHLHTVSRDQHGEVTCAGATATVWGSEDARPWRDLVKLYRLARDAYAVGLLRRMFDLTVGYAKERVQFGRPIGGFQAVQYRCADMAIAYYGAETNLYQAAWLVDRERLAARELAIAHAVIRDAAGEISTHAHQVHGAMGFTGPYPLQVYSRRAKVYQHTLGTASHFRERIAAEEETLVMPEAGEPIWGGFP
jgi:alkylation response protein AidB-like acyl-CoA dehydrogenase